MNRFNENADHSRAFSSPSGTIGYPNSILPYRWANLTPKRHARVWIAVAHNEHWSPVAASGSFVL
jgi:hypothetical protein